jgi:hypothetical protein
VAWCCGGGRWCSGCVGEVGRQSAALCVRTVRAPGSHSGRNGGVVEGGRGEGEPAMACPLPFRYCGTGRDRTANTGQWWIARGWWRDKGPRRLIPTHPVNTPLTFSRRSVRLTGGCLYHEGSSTSLNTVGLLGLLQG